MLREDGSREVRYVKEGDIAEREVVSEREFLESYDKNVAEHEWKDEYLGAMADTGGDGRGNNVVERIVGYDADGFRTESGRVLPFDDVRGGSVRVFDPDNAADLLGMTIVSPTEARARNTARDVNDGNQGAASEQDTADAERLSEEGKTGQTAEERLAEENNTPQTLANPQENGNFAAENGGEHLAVNITQNAGADVSDGNGGFTARNRMGTLNEQDRQTVKTNFAMLQDPNATPEERARAEEAVEGVKVRRKNQMRVLVNEAIKDIEGVSNPEIEAGIGVYTDDSGNVVTEYTCVVHLDVAKGKEDAAIAAMSLISETTRQDAFIVNYDKAAEGQQQRGDHSYEARVTLDRPLTNAETARLTQEFRNNGLDVTITDRAITSLSWPESDADRVVFENKVKKVIDSYNNASRTNNGRQGGRQAPQDNRGTWSAEQGNGEGVVADAHRVSSESGTVQGGDNNTGNTLRPPVFSDHYSDYNSANITNGKYVNHEGREFANQDKRNYGGATDPATGARTGYYQENDVYIQGTSVTPKDLRERLKRKYEETERKDYDYARSETQQQSQQTLDISGSTAKELIERRAEQRKHEVQQQQQQQQQARAAMSDEQRLVYDAVSDRLDKAGIKVELATEEEEKTMSAEDEAQVKSSGEVFRSGDGEVLGWADKDGGIHLTQGGMNPETPIHEYSHLWGRMMKRRNPELWKSIVEMCRSEENKVWWDAVANDPNYAHLNGDADAIASEMMSRYVGRKGAKRLEAEARKMYEQARRNGTVRDGITVRSFVHKMRQSVLYYWNRVAEFLGIRRFKNLEDIERGVIGDLMNGRKFRPEEIKSSSSERLSSSVADPLGNARERVQRWRSNSSLDDFIAQELGMTAERMSQSLSELPQRVREGMESRLTGIGERLERIEALDATERELEKMFTEEYDWEQREQTREAVEEHLRQVREERERLKNEIRGLEEELDNTLLNRDLFYEDTMADGLRRGERSNDSGEQSSGTLGEDYEPFKAGDLRDLTAEELVLAAMRQNAERVGEAGNNGKEGVEGLHKKNTLNRTISVQCVINNQDF